MPLTLRDVDLDLDHDELFACEWAAWTQPPQAMFSIMFPVHGNGPADEAEAIKAGAALQLAGTKADAHDHWLKVVDTSTGKIVAGAQWKIYKENPYRAPVKKFDAAWWPEGSEMRDLTNSMYTQLSCDRPKMMGTAHCYLYNIFTHPSYRHRGAASLLVGWGTRLADEMGVEAYVEATYLGKPLYEKYGFAVMQYRQMRFENENPSEEWKRAAADLQANPTAVMWRPIGGKYEKGKTVIPWEGKPRDE